MTHVYGQQFRVFAYNAKRGAVALGAALTLCLISACSVGSDGPAEESGGSANSAGAGPTGPTIGTSFELRPEWDVASCAKAGIVDVNLGNSAESFVRAAYCQVNGSPASEAVVTEWAGKLRTLSYVRRIDVVLSFCQAAARSCTLSYSDPWTVQSALSTPCTRSGTRELGAVLMFFNECPGGTNCQMDWANTHAAGMSSLSPLLEFPPAASGVYAPKNPGFWRREMLDAAYAGVQFFLLNVYGPDLSSSVDPLGQLSKALDDTGNVVKIGLFDDTSSWGRPGAGVFSTRPDFAAPTQAAQTIYDAKWKPFFARVPKASWYLFHERPLIYFYNSGSLYNSKSPQPDYARVGGAATIRALREHFMADFGVSPFIAVDHGFLGDPDMLSAADGTFSWDTFRINDISLQTVKDVQLAHFMVKWDALGRDNLGKVAKIATATDRIIKDDTLLKQRLDQAKSSQITVIATWNDLGEGTGVARNYDYFAHGEWQPPDVFLKDLRAWQCSN